MPRLPIVAFALASILTTGTGFAQTYAHVADFSLSATGAIAIDASGNIFFASNGVDGGQPGSLYELTPSGKLVDLHDFGGTLPSGYHDGGIPQGVYIDPYGNLFGTCGTGGRYGSGAAIGGGILWECSASGTYVDLHDFGGMVPDAQGQSNYDGKQPNSELALGPDGTIYGTTIIGGAGNEIDGYIYRTGVVWSYSHGAYKDLHDFGPPIINANGTKGPDGQNPAAGVAIDTKGNLYGTTQVGGANQWGMVWKLTPAGAYSDLHDFGGRVTDANGTMGLDGQEGGEVVVNSAGTIYGITSSGGGYSSGVLGGVLWSVSPSGAYSDLHDFGGSTVVSDGTTGPDSSYAISLRLGPDDNLYGSCLIGGPYVQSEAVAGSLWTYTHAGRYYDLHDFGGTITGAGGTQIADKGPSSGVIFDSHGALLGLRGFNSQWESSFIWRISQGIRAMTVSPSQIVGGKTAAAAVYLALPASASGVTISLSSSSASVVVPAKVSIPSDSIATAFTVKTNAAAADTKASIAASADGTSSSAAVKVLAAIPSLLTLSPAAVAGGQSLTAKLTLTGAAPSAGTTVGLSTTSSAVKPPASVTIQPGQSSITFAITTLVVPTQAAVTVRAERGSALASAVLTVNPPKVSSLTLQPKGVIGGVASVATVTISATAPSAGVPVSISSSSASAKVPSSVKIPAGTTSVTFKIVSVAVSANTSATIATSTVSGSKSAVLTVYAPTPSALTLKPTTVAGGQSSTATLSLDGPAPTGGVSVSLKSNTSAATVPATVLVLAGKTSATFTVKTIKVKSQASVTITGTANGVSTHGILVVSP